MEEKFKEQLAAFLANKKQLLIPTEEKYDEMVAVIQNRAVGPTKKLSQNEINLLRRYSVRIENTVATLYHQGEKPNDAPQKVVKQEGLFVLLKATHARLGHAGRNIMWQEFRGYYGISKYAILGSNGQFFSFFRELILMFVKLCAECEKKKGKPKKVVVVKPIVSKEQNERCQVDLIDLQACPDEEYKFILVYQVDFRILFGSKLQHFFRIISRSL